MNDPPPPVPAENADAENTATLVARGPLEFRGDLALVDREGAVLMTETRMTLCRCGASARKPFCDDSHARVGFDDPGALCGPDVAEAGGERGGRLALRLNHNGPLVCTGALTLKGANGRTARDVTTFLCRCGGSQNKPYCDGTHKRNGFTG